MSFMKSLTLTVVPKIQNDPVRSRRDRLVSRLLEQKELISNPSLVRTVQRAVKRTASKPSSKSNRRSVGGGGPMRRDRSSSSFALGGTCWSSRRERWESSLDRWSDCRPSSTP